MNRNLILAIALIVLVLSFVVLIYLGYWMTTEGAKCVMNPTEYVVNKTGGYCGCFAKVDYFNP